MEVNGKRNIWRLNGVINEITVWVWNRNTLGKQTVQTASCQGRSPCAMSQGVYALSSLNYWKRCNGPKKTFAEIYKYSPVLIKCIIFSSPSRSPAMVPESSASTQPLV